MLVCIRKDDAVVDQDHSLAHRTRIDATWRNRKKLEKEVAFLYIFLIYKIFCDVHTMAGGENLCVTLWTTTCFSVVLFVAWGHFIQLVVLTTTCQISPTPALYFCGGEVVQLFWKAICVLSLSQFLIAGLCAHCIPLISSWRKPKIQLRPEVWFPLDQDHIDFPTYLY